MEYIYYAIGTIAIIAVSYTHLDVYKRQVYRLSNNEEYKEH